MRVIAAIITICALQTPAWGQQQEGKCVPRKGLEFQQNICENQKRPTCNLQSLCIWREGRGKPKAAAIADNLELEPSLEKIVKN